MKQWHTLLILIAAALALATPPAAAQDLVLYAGRSQTLIEPLIERFEEESGIDVRVRYGRDAELLATLAEEGSASPADVVWFNTAGALGAANNLGLLQDLPQDLLGKAAAYTPSSGRWVPLTTRFRVLAYNTDRVQEKDLPASVLDLPDFEQFKGRIGWTPTYSSFQDFVTALRLTQGEQAAKQWLEGMQALEPRAYTSNTPMIQALASGEIDVAITNHYYVLRLLDKAEQDSSVSAPVSLHYFEPGDVGNLALVTGGGILKTAGEPEAAQRFLAFLLTPESQSFAAQSVHEYPVTQGVELPEDMLPMERVLKVSPEFDFERLRELDETLRLLREVGLL